MKNRLGFYFCWFFVLCSVICKRLKAKTLEMHDNGNTNNKSKQQIPHKHTQRDTEMRNKIDKYHSECEKSTLSAKWVEIHMTRPFGRFLLRRIHRDFSFFLLHFGSFCDKIIHTCVVVSSHLKYSISIYIFHPSLPCILLFGYIISACNANFMQATL